MSRTFSMPARAQRVGRPLCGAADVAACSRQRADAGDGEVLLQLVDVAIAVDVDEIDDVVHAGVHMRQS